MSRCAASVTFSVPRVVSGRADRICTSAFSTSSCGSAIAAAMASGSAPARRIRRAWLTCLAESAIDGRSNWVRRDISPDPLPGALPLKAIGTTAVYAGHHPPQTLILPATGKHAQII